MEEEGRRRGWWGSLRSSGDLRETGGALDAGEEGGEEDGVEGVVEEAAEDHCCGGDGRDAPGCGSRAAGDRRGNTELTRGRVLPRYALWEYCCLR